MEALTQFIASKFLSKFITDINKLKLSFQALGPQACLKNVSINPTLFNSIPLPFDVKQAKIGMVTLKLNPFRFLSNSIEVCISDIILIVKEKHTFDSGTKQSKKSDGENINEIKIKLADAWEKQYVSALNSKIKAENSFFGNIVTKLINKVTVRVKNVFILYETVDRFNLLLTVDMVSGLESKNVNDLIGKKFSDVSNFFCKNVSLRNLSIFTKENENCDWEDLIDKFNKDQLNFLYKNSKRFFESMHFKMDIAVANNIFKTDFSCPKILIKCHTTAHLKLFIDRTSYLNALRIAHKYLNFAEYFKRHFILRKMQPSDVPNDWWDYIRKAFFQKSLNFYRESGLQKTVIETLNDKQKYVENYIHYFETGFPNPDVNHSYRDIINEIESKNNLKTIILFRKTTIQTLYAYNKHSLIRKKNITFVSKVSNFIFKNANSNNAQNTVKPALSIEKQREIANNSFVDPFSTTGAIDYPFSFKDIQINFNAKNVGICTTNALNPKTTEILVSALGAVSIGSNELSVNVIVPFFKITSESSVILSQTMSRNKRAQPFLSLKFDSAKFDHKTDRTKSKVLLNVAPFRFYLKPDFVVEMAKLFWPKDDDGFIAFAKIDAKFFEIGDFEGLNKFSTVLKGFKRKVSAGKNSFKVSVAAESVTVLLPIRLGEGNPKKLSLAADNIILNVFDYGEDNFEFGMCDSFDKTTLYLQKNLLKSEKLAKTQMKITSIKIESKNQNNLIDLKELEISFFKNAQNNPNAIIIVPKLEEIFVNLIPKDVFAILVQIDRLAKEMANEMRFFAEKDRIKKNGKNGDSEFSENEKGFLVVNCKLKRFELFLSVLDEVNGSVLRKINLELGKIVFNLKNRKTSNGIHITAKSFNLGKIRNDSSNLIDHLFQPPIDSRDLEMIKIGIDLQNQNTVKINSELNKIAFRMDQDILVETLNFVQTELINSFESRCKGLFEFGDKNETKRETRQKESIQSLELKMEIWNAAVVLVHEGKEISSVCLSDSRLFLTKTGQKLDLKIISSVLSVDFLNCLNDGNRRQIGFFETRENTLSNFELALTKKNDADTTINLTLNDIECRLLKTFIDQTVEFFQNGPFLRKIKTFAKPQTDQNELNHKTPKPTKNKNRLNLFVKLNRVVLFLPKNSQKSGNFGINIVDLEIFLKKRDFFVHSKFETNLFIELKALNAMVNSKDGNNDGLISGKAKVVVKGGETEIHVGSVSLDISDEILIKLQKNVKSNLSEARRQLYSNEPGVVEQSENDKNEVAMPKKIRFIAENGHFGLGFENKADKIDFEILNVKGSASILMNHVDVDVFVEYALLTDKTLTLKHPNLSKIIELSKTSFSLKTDQSTFATNTKISLAFPSVKVVISSLLAPKLKNIRTLLTSFGRSSPPKTSADKNDRNRKNVKITTDLKVGLEKIDVLVTENASEENPYCFQTRAVCDLVLLVQGDEIFVNVTLGGSKMYGGFYKNKEKLRGNTKTMEWSAGFLEYADKTSIIFIEGTEESKSKTISVVLDKLKVRMSERGMQMVKRLALAFSLAEKTDLIDQKLLNTKPDLHFQNDGIKLHTDQKDPIKQFGKTKLILQIGSIELTVLSRSSRLFDGKNLETLNPIVRVCVEKLGGDLQSFGTESNLVVDFCVKADYFNQNINKTELLIEKSFLQFILSDDGGIQRYEFRTNEKSPNVNINVTSQTIRQILRIVEIASKKENPRENVRNEGNCQNRDEKPAKRVKTVTVYKTATILFVNDTERTAKILLGDSEYLLGEFNRVEVFNKKKPTTATLIFATNPSNPISCIPVRRKTHFAHFVIPAETVSVVAKPNPKKSLLQKSGPKLKKAFNLASPLLASSSPSNERSLSASSFKAGLKKAVSVSKSTFKRKIMRKRLKTFLKTSDFGVPDRVELFPGERSAVSAESAAERGVSAGNSGLKVEPERLLSFLALVTVVPEEGRTVVRLHSDLRFRNKTGYELEVGGFRVPAGEERWVPFGVARAQTLLMAQLVKNQKSDEISLPVNHFEKEAQCGKFSFAVGKIKFFYVAKFKYDAKSKQKTVAVTPQLRFGNFLFGELCLAFGKNRHGEVCLSRAIPAGEFKSYGDVSANDFLSYFKVPDFDLESNQTENIKSLLKNAKKGIFKINLKNSRNQKFIMSAEIKKKNKRTTVVFYNEFWVYDFSQSSLIFSSENESVPEAIEIKKTQNIEKPHTFDFKSEKDKLYCAIPFCKKWSEPLSVDAVGSINYVSEFCPETKHAMGKIIELGYKIKYAPRKFYRTKIIEFYPKFIVKNELPFALSISTPEKNAESFEIDKNSIKRYDFSQSKSAGGSDLERSLRIRDAEANKNWTRLFPVDQVGEHILKLGDKDGGGFEYVCVEVVIKNCTFYVVVFAKEANLLPFLIENRTFCTAIEYCQNSQSTWAKLEPSYSSYYAWTDPNSPKVLQVRLYGRPSTVLDIELEAGMTAKLERTAKDPAVYVFVDDKGLNSRCVFSNFKKSNFKKTISLIPSEQSCAKLKKLLNEFTTTLTKFRKIDEMSADEKNYFILPFKITILSLASNGNKKLQVLFKSEGKVRASRFMAAEDVGLNENFSFFVRMNGDIEIQINDENSKKIGKNKLSLKSHNNAIGIEKTISLHFQKQNLEVFLKISICFEDETRLYESAVFNLSRLYTRVDRMTKVKAPEIEKSVLKIKLSRFENFGFGPDENVKHLVAQIGRQTKLKLVTPATDTASFRFKGPSSFEGEIAFFLFSGGVRFSARLKTELLQRLGGARAKGDRRPLLRRATTGEARAEAAQVALAPDGGGEFGGPAPSFELGVEIKRLSAVKTQARSKAVAALGAVGVSLVDERGREIAFVALERVALAAVDIGERLLVSAMVNEFQVDVSVKNAKYPHLIAETPVLEKETKPFFQLSLDTENIDQSLSQPALLLNFLSILIQEIDIKFEECFIIAMIEFYFEISSAIDLKSAEEVQRTDVSKELFGFERNPSVLIRSKILQLNSLAFNLSVKLAAETRLKALLKDSAAKRALASVLNGLSAVDDVPLRFKALIVTHAHGSADTLLAPIALQYRQQALYQSYKLLGSLDVLGSPLQLVNNLGDGVYSLFYYPAQGFVRSPEEFASGISKGALGFVSSSFKGVFGSAHKLTSRLARGVTGLAGDDEEGAGGRAAERGRAASGAEFGRSVVSGLAGLVRKPVEGARRGGVGGFFKGVGKGVVGVVSKPVGSALGMVSSTFEGMAKMPEYLLLKARMVGAPRGRKRPRRARCRNGQEPYNELEALAQELIEKFPAKADNETTAARIGELEEFRALKVLRKRKEAVVFSNFRILFVSLFDGKILINDDSADNSLAIGISAALSQVTRLELSLAKCVVAVHAPFDSVHSAAAVAVHTVSCGSAKKAESLFAAIAAAVRAALPAVRSACVGDGRAWFAVTDELNRLISERAVGKSFGADLSVVFADEVRALGAAKEKCKLVVEFDGEGKEKQKIVQFDELVWFE